VNDVTMSLLDDGTVLHDFGPGSCFSCGGTVRMVWSESGKECARCASCGPVQWVVYHSDDGTIMQGYMTPAELAAQSLLQDDQDAEWLF
jgi:hypothetical protein